MSNPVGYLGSRAVPKHQIHPLLLGIMMARVSDVQLGRSRFEKLWVPLPFRFHNKEPTAAVDHRGCCEIASVRIGHRMFENNRHVHGGEPIAEPVHDAVALSVLIDVSFAVVEADERMRVRGLEHLLQFFELLHEEGTQVFDTCQASPSSIAANSRGVGAVKSRRADLAVASAFVVIIWSSDDWSILAASSSASMMSGSDARREARCRNWLALTGTTFQIRPNSERSSVLPAPGSASTTKTMPFANTSCSVHFSLPTLSCRPT